VNDSLSATPEDINKDPFGSGWIFKVSVSEEPQGLLDAAGYRELTA
jgi:glycine cleavage system H protein